MMYPDRSGMSEDRIEIEELREYYEYDNTGLFEYKVRFKVKELNADLEDARAEVSELENSLAEWNAELLRLQEEKEKPCPV